VLPVKETIEERACKLAQYIMEEKATVRAAAKQFGVSKSTVHIEVTL
jgi:putative DeoR family transcriptional regulator (stage III sporulation protein D)